MIGNAAGPRGSTAPRWIRRLGYVVAVLLLLVVSGYVVRRTLFLAVARVLFNRSAALVAQEKADGVQIIFAKLPAPWVAPMKNVMNAMWKPIGAEGVNYYSFAGPSNVFRSYSERSNPASPYYQAWVGSYVTKRRDGTMPKDLTAWATRVTELDRRSWLAAMGDPAPLAESAPPSSAGTVVVDGRTVELWHGTMLSHSDLTDRTGSPLAMLVGMPARSSWPAGVRPFHEVRLDGYFVGWSDSSRRVSIIVYAVSVTAPDNAPPGSRAPRDIRGELLRLLKTASAKWVR